MRRSNPSPLRYALVGSGNNILGVTSTEREAAGLGQAMGANVVVDRSIKLDGFREANPPTGPGSPNQAWRAMNGLRIDAKKAASMDLEDAFILLWSKFPLLRNGSTIKAWSSAGEMANNLLGQNYKTAKGRAGTGKKKKEGKPLPASQLQILRDKYGASGVDVKGLTLLPNVVWTKITGRAKINTCIGATRECAESCLVYSGRNEADPYNTVIKSAKLTALMEEPDAFGRMLIEACRRHLAPRNSANLRMVRLNVFSDIPWEIVFPELFDLVPGIYYDYTKVPHRQLPSNYDMTFSYSGRNLSSVDEELARGRRVAVVFLAKRHELPESMMGLPVVDGDISDARPLDPPGVIVGLSYKAPKKRGKVDKHDNVFVVPVHEIDGHLVAAVVPRDQPDTEEPAANDQAPANVSLPIVA